MTKLHTVLFLSSLGLLLLGCDGDPATPDSGCAGAGCVGPDSGARDAGGGMDSGAGTDSGTGTDSGPAPVDAQVEASDAAEGAPCGFNRDCSATQRCECSETTGCFCMTGTRGTGQVGVDTCTDGNDCASALCVEGPVDGTFYCSDECATETDCAGMLPRCLDIAFVGRICARVPPDAG